MARQIDRSSPIPFYVQLADLLRARIADGELAAGDPLPSEAALCETFGLSRTAVRDALRVLSEERLVIKEKGRGSFVAPRQHTPIVIHDVRGFVEEMARHGRAVTTRLIELARVPIPPGIAPLLEQPIGSDAIRLERVRLLDSVPVLEAITHLPAGRFGALLEEDLTAASLYDLLQTRFATRPTGGPRRITAVAADARMARRLEIAEGSPLLQLTAINRDQEGRPIEHFVARYRPDLTAFDFAISTGRAGHHAELSLAAVGGAA